MVKDLVGYRFAPSGEELINYYLKNKILGKSWLVDEAISEINICDYDPNLLPPKSKIKSEDPVWYFFSPKEYTSTKKKVTKRTTSSGYWKATGVDRKIKDTKRRGGGEIGIKKTLVYYEGRVPNGVWTPWVMHEYHITCLPGLPQDQRNYVICQVMYKGEDGDILFGGNNNSSEPSDSLVSDSDAFKVMINNTPPEPNYDGLSVDDVMLPTNQQRQEILAPWDVLDPNTLFSDNHNNINNYPNMHYPQPQQTHYSAHHQDNDDEFLNGLRHFKRGEVEHLFSDDDAFISRPYRSNYNTPPEVGQSSGENELYGLCVDDLMLPISPNMSAPMCPILSPQRHEDLAMLENYNNHRPRKALSGIIVDYSNDSDDDDNDAESISATSYQGTLSPGDSVGSSDKHFSSCSSTKSSCKDLQTRLTRRNIQIKQSNSRTIVAKTENKKKKMKDLFVIDYAMMAKTTNKKPKYVYLMNMIIGLILLVALVGDIAVSILSTVKT